MDKLFDSKCLELAQHFFPSAPKKIQEHLAGDIQDTVETFGEWFDEFRGPNPERSADNGSA